EQDAQYRRRDDAESDRARPVLRRQPCGGHPDHDRIVAGEHDVDDDHRHQRAHLVQREQHARDIGTKPGIVETIPMIISATPRRQARPALRLGAFYAASFLVVGIQLPFWPVWLAGRGLDPQQIAFVFAAAIWAKVIATPALGAVADRFGRSRAVMVALAAAATVGYAALWPAAGFWPILALNLVAGVAQSALMP